MDLLAVSDNNAFDIFVTEVFETRVKERRDGDRSGHQTKYIDTYISQILYEFNIIWRNIMKKENDAVV